MGMKGRIALSAVVGVVVIGVVSANSGSDEGDGGKGTSASAEHDFGDKGGDGGARTGDTEKAAARSRAAFGGDGSYQVGKDVKPGTYRTRGNSDGMCYWERAKNASGDMDSLLANDNVTGSSYVTVKASDKLFKSEGCHDWETVDPKAEGKPSAAGFKGDGGMLRVGVDIAPGTYRSAGNTDDQCYWERDKDALHGMESILANDNVTGTAVVTIGAHDAYFKTAGCKDWKHAG
ncbi:hypothetical protein QFZ63_004704 [Streptomyces sp. B3I7]|uniref:hypothetical protein n=1 Tax=Streptomyces sp. B3I7 TaxID=3042269 RepID=UPI002788B398|nr:hypothetical protein [Streptomyces sp. B3I7]MDQ0812990.1 hypothetical protein [Streptomyces sp. B3I7]